MKSRAKVYEKIVRLFGQPSATLPCSEWYNRLWPWISVWAFKGLIRHLKSLIKPFKGLIRPFKGLISPLKGLIRPFKGLIRPLKRFCKAL